MRLILKSDILAQLQPRFRAWLESSCRKDVQVAERVRKLVSVPTEEITERLVREIMGRPNYTENLCNECGRDSEVLVRFGDEPDYDVQWQDLCPECLQEGIRMATLAPTVDTEREG